jgi:hypothetical protein
MHSSMSMSWVGPPLALIPSMLPPTPSLLLSMVRFLIATYQELPSWTALHQPDCVVMIAGAPDSGPLIVIHPSSLP